MTPDKLFIVTRADLPPGAIAAQSTHVALAFAVEHPEVFRVWHGGSNNIVLLSVPDEGALVRLASRAVKADVECTFFKEPDFGDSVTAVAIGPSGWRLVSSLPLALRKPKQAA
jgi:peptidyl-tRNA hydrolase